MKKTITKVLAGALAVILAVVMNVPTWAYTVESGDTMNDIAAKFKVSADELAEWNNIKDKNLIFPGQEIFTDDETAKNQKRETVLTKEEKAMLFDMFDADFYASAYPDVEKALGAKNEEKLFEHFCLYGLNELRQSNPAFNVAVYSSAYNDLSKAFGTDVIAYYKHYNDYGKKENRAITSLDAYIEAGMDTKLIFSQTTEPDENGRPQFAKFFVDESADFVAPKDSSAPANNPPAEVKYEVSFDLNGHGSAGPEKQQVGKGGKAVNPYNPARDGNLAVSGWYTDAACTDKWNFRTDVVSGDVTLYAKWMDVTLFKAAANTSTKTLLLFYGESVPSSYSGFEVFSSPVPVDNNSYPWGSSADRLNYEKIVIDSSLDGLGFILSTKSMFYDFRNAYDITGCEYLDTSQVKTMNEMFMDFGIFTPNGQTLKVPNVSNWDTSKVTDMSNMFKEFGGATSILNAHEYTVAGVPDVSKWDTGNVTTMSDMFRSYGSCDSSFNAVPDVSNFNTSKVTKMLDVFYDYAEKSNVINVVPDVSKWDVSRVTDIRSIFRDYAEKSVQLNQVPDISGWSLPSGAYTNWWFQNYGKAAVAAGKLSAESIPQ